MMGPLAISPTPGGSMPEAVTPATHDVAPPAAGNMLLERLTALAPLEALAATSHDSTPRDVRAGALGVTADAGVVDGTPVVTDGAVTEPAEATPLLQQMARAATHLDVAAQRHGAVGDGGERVSTPATSDATASTAPLADAMALPVVAPQLHVPPSRLPSEPVPPPPGRPRGGGHDPDPPPGEAPPAPTPPRTEAREPSPVGADPETEALRRFRAVVDALGVQATHPAVRPVLDELRRQRRVLVATPVSPTDGLRQAASVHVLCPRPGGGRAWRLAGELLWAAPPADGRWWDVHLVKAQSGSVRRLEPLSDARRVAVCLGAQAVPMTAWADACLRVRDGTRLWQALEPQWSLRLLLGATVLDGVGT